MKVLLVFCALVVSVGAHAQTFSCPAGTEDMMNYFLMSYPDRIDKHMEPGTRILPSASSCPKVDPPTRRRGFFSG